MKVFTLRIELGNDAMQTGDDIFAAIKEAEKSFSSEPFEVGWSEWVYDINGNKVGKWSVTEEKGLT